ncbi:aminoglycoside phosphotransferase domain protein [Mycobacterium xenopi 4042]|uniref:Aminoglycoside phosphotransferase domain protein n=1 Tax=Mycobacterium xenopi 4042 TaxID=1299334 RepID=X7YIM6_MYCXE|nr:aminoglycoside phosphotransferase domain protein [Mycobacterium xenopi 4042]
MSVERPPEHVLAAFGLSGVQPVPLGDSWEGGWRCGEVVLSMVADHARAAWSARVRETLFVDGSDWPAQSVPPMADTSFRAGAPIHSSPVGPSRATTRWSRRRCGCTRRPASWSVRAF